MYVVICSYINVMIIFVLTTINLILTKQVKKYDQNDDKVDPEKLPGLEENDLKPIEGQSERDRGLWRHLTM